MDAKALDNRHLLWLGLAALAAGFIVPGIPFIYIGLPVAALALAWVTGRFGWAAGCGLALLAAAAVAAGGPLVGLDRLNGVFVAVAFLAVGPAATLALGRYPGEVVVLVLGLLLAAGFALSPAGIQARNEVMVAALPLAQVFSGKTATTDQVNLLAEQFRTQFALVWPAFVFYLMGLCALITVPLVAIVARRTGHEVRRFTPLAEFDASFHFVWPAIGGLALLAAGTFLQHGRGWMVAVGLNALLIVRPVLVAQGLADFAALYKRLNLGRVTRVIGYSSLIFAELIIPSTSVLGLVDLFFNLRKLPRPGSAPTAAGDASKM